MSEEKTTLEMKIEDRLYQFICDPNSGLGEVYDVLSRMRNYIYERIVATHKEEYRSQENVEENVVVDEQ